MKKEDKLYIETELYKIISLNIEAQYNLDKFGNIVFKDRAKALQKISTVIENASKEREIPINEIEDYIIQICRGKVEEMQNPLFEQEETEIIFIIEEIKNRRFEENKQGDIPVKESKSLE